MAVTFDAIWTGSTDSLWTEATNWNPANVPTAAEDIFVPIGTPAIDATGMADTQYGVLHIARGHALDIGATGTPLNGGFTDIRHNGQGKLWYQQVAQTTSRIIIDSPGGVDAANIDGTISVGVWCFRGLTTISGSAAVLPFLEVAYRDNPATDVQCVLAPGANAVTLINQCGGLITAKGRPITTYYLDSGEGQIWVGQAVTTVTVRGRLDYRSNSTITTLTVAGGGVADFTQGRTSDVAVTNTFRHPASTILRDPNLVDLGTEYDWRN